MQLRLHSNHAGQQKDKRRTARVSPAEVLSAPLISAAIDLVLRGTRSRTKRLPQLRHRSGLAATDVPRISARPDWAASMSANVVRHDSHACTTLPTMSP